MVTLEISSTDIRIMEIDKGKVVKWASQLLEPGLFEEEVVTDPVMLGNAIRKLMASTGIADKNVITGVSGLYSLSRIVLVSVPMGEITPYQTVVDATNEVMPVSEEEMYISWQTIGSVEGGQQVLVVSVPKDVVDSEMKSLRSAGLKVRVLDLKAMAIMRAVNKDQALIINIDTESYDVMLVMNGLAEIMHTVAWKPDGLSPKEQAEQLALALELTVGFYNAHHPEYLFSPGTPLIITGQMSGDADLVQAMHESTNYRIEPLVPPLECPPNLPASQYAVNIGLALKGAHPGIVTTESIYPLPDINLLPGAYRPWRPTMRQAYAVLAVVTILGLLVPLYRITTEEMAKTARMEAEFSSLNSLLEMRQQELAKRDPLQKAITSYESIVTPNSDVTGDLKVILEAAGDLGVTISSVVDNIDSISVNCQAESYTAFRDFKTALEDSGRFSSPVTPPEGYPYIKGGIIKLTPLPAK